ncbi:hypothetical protein Bbelb_233130 [Branchiostoma belcheri]|nr:hypothetical protein Bbelb_233130 [Branchiostoma belcheri]
MGRNSGREETWCGLSAAFYSSFTYSVQLHDSHHYVTLQHSTSLCTAFNYTIHFTTYSVQLQDSHHFVQHSHHHGKRSTARFTSLRFTSPRATSTSPRTTLNYTTHITMYNAQLHNSHHYVQRSTARFTSPHTTFNYTTHIPTYNVQLHDSHHHSTVRTRYRKAWWRLDHGGQPQASYRTLFPWARFSESNICADPSARAVPCRAEGPGAPRESAIAPPACRSMRHRRDLTAATPLNYPRNYASNAT